MDIDVFRRGLGTRLAFCRAVLATGIPAFVSSFSRARLIVLNYHRLWSTVGSTTVFDDGVFDTDVETFRRQMEWLRRETVVLDEEQLLRVCSSDYVRREVIYSAVTFDDGYADCVTLARPILDSLGIRGLFFIPIEMIDSRRLGWWDLAANLLKRSVRKVISIDGRYYDLENDLFSAHRAILDRFKLDPAEKTATLLDQLAAACGVPLATLDDQSAELMTWDDICELRSAGHAIGAHSLSHRVLATLDTGEQAREICDSGRFLEAKLGCRVASFSYPVGGPAHINQHSIRLVREAGYAQAFTFKTGIASLPVKDRFQLPRESASSVEILKAKALLPGVMGLRTAPALP